MFVQSKGIDMVPSFAPSSKTPPGRVAIRVALCAAALVAVVWSVWPDQSRWARAFTQVPSDKPRLTAAQVMARFPKEKHEEFMRRAIANSRKAGVEYKTGGAFGAVIVTSDGKVIADGLNHVIAQNDP